jgi:hypothetical protein
MDNKGIVLRNITELSHQIDAVAARTPEPTQDREEAMDYIQVGGGEPSSPRKKVVFPALNLAEVGPLLPLNGTSISSFPSFPSSRSKRIAVPLPMKSFIFLLDLANPSTSVSEKSPAETE